MQAETDLATADIPKRIPAPGAEVDGPDSSPRAAMSPGAQGLLPTQIEERPETFLHLLVEAVLELVELPEEIEDRTYRLTHVSFLSSHPAFPTPLLLPAAATLHTAAAGPGPRSSRSSVGTRLAADIGPPRHRRSCATRRGLRTTDTLHYMCLALMGTD